MCDEAMLRKWAKQGLNRRQFGAVAGMAAIAACSPNEVGAENLYGSSNTGGSRITGALAEAEITFDTPDGTMDGLFIHPSDGQHPGVIFWPDIAGIRPAKQEMARRLAKAGYAVLLANPYYRDVAGQQFADFAEFAASGGFQKVGPWRRRFSLQTVQTDAAACADWLAGQDAVDQSRGIGTQGYCMTGSFAVIGPSAHSRIKAGASFHGGGLVRAEGPSPHKTLREDAHYLIAVAQDDDAKSPGDKTVLGEAAAKAGTDAEIAVYAGDHGWCVLDSPSYAEDEAEKAWAALLELYGRAL